MNVPTIAELKAPGETTGILLHLDLHGVFTPEERKSHAGHLKVFTIKKTNLLYAIN